MPWAGKCKVLTKKIQPGVVPGFFFSEYRFDHNPSGPPSRFVIEVTLAASF